MLERAALPGIEIKAPLRTLALSIAALILALNALFAASLFIPFSQPRLCARIDEAYANGSLGYPSHVFDTVHGVDSYTDCLVLAAAIIHAGGPRSDGLASRFVEDGDNCGLLRAICDRHENPATGPYHRYWVGERVLSSVLVEALGVLDEERLCKLLDCLSIALFGLAALAVSRRLFATLGTISFFGLAFSGAPIFGATFSHAPATIWAFASCALLIFFSRTRLRSETARRLFLVAAGCIGCYLDLLDGVPMQPLLILVTVYFLECEERPAPEALRRTAVQFALWCTGFLSTMFLKQLLANVVYPGDPVWSAFYNQLRHRLSPTLTGVVPQTFSRWNAFPRLWLQFPQLAYNSKPLANALAIFSLAGWLLAAIFSLREKLGKKLVDLAKLGADLTACLLFTLFLACWYFALSNHTQFHAWFSVRAVFVPLALGWVLCARYLVTKRAHPL